MTRSRIFVIDSREKKPLKLKRPYVTQPLKVGDYSIRGYTQATSVEYKGKQDFFSWLYSPRFQRQIDKLLTLRYKCVVVGADLRSKHYNNLTTHSVDKKVAELISRGIPVVFTGGRLRAATLIVALLEDSVRRLRYE